MHIKKIKKKNEENYERRIRVLWLLVIVVDYSEQQNRLEINYI
jgi:hypothetical protein